MKKLTVFICALLLVFGVVVMAKAEVILFEDFEDPSGFTLAGCVPLYWGIAPLEGTTIPSNFLQGSSSQLGNIFYGSLAKQNSFSPAATMTIILPDLTGYTNLQLTVALAAAVGIWETTHRDSLRIIGGTTISPPVVDCSGAHGCQSVPGEIDSFLPITYPDDLCSNVHSICLGRTFQDFAYTIDSSMKSLTFAFASTASVEVVGIDSVRITGDPLSEPVSIDIIPKSCPNECHIKGSGFVKVAILGTGDFDVNDIDIASVRLEGVPPTRSSLKDKSSPVVDPQTECECTTDGRDGEIDLCLKFDKKEIINALGGVTVDEEYPLTLSGELNDGTAIEGMDCIVFVGKEKKD